MNDLKYFKKTKNCENEISTRVLQIKVDDIRPNRAQPRAEFEENSIIRLADSIRRYGILQPLTVRPSDPEDIYSYELIAGERRLRAAKLLGYLTVPCVILEVTEQISAELAIIENLLREDLNMFEQAYGFRKLIDNYHLTQEEVARRMSLSQSAVANKLRLLRLSYEEQCLILETGLTERHARACIRINDPKLRLDAIRHIANSKLNVSATDHYVEEILDHEESKRKSVEKGNSVISNRFLKSERDILDMVSSLQKRVNLWNQAGKSISFQVKNQSSEVQVTISIAKQSDI